VVAMVGAMRRGKAADLVQATALEMLPYIAFPREHWTRPAGAA
jgi:hypothetical protein